MVVIHLLMRMVYNDAMVAPDLHLCSGIRMLHDDAVLAADRNASCRSLFPWTFVCARTPYRHRCHQDQEKKTP